MSGSERHEVVETKQVVSQISHASVKAAGFSYRRLNWEYGSAIFSAGRPLHV
jgi:hypothetical protein